MQLEEQDESADHEKSALKFRAIKSPREKTSTDKKRKMVRQSAGKGSTMHKKQGKKPPIPLQKPQGLSKTTSRARQISAKGAVKRLKPAAASKRAKKKSNAGSTDDAIRRKAEEEKREEAREIAEIDQEIAEVQRELNKQLRELDLPRNNEL